MVKNINKRNTKITIGVLTLFIGLCIIGSTYYETKKYEVFDDMNELYYEQIVDLEEDIDEIEEESSSDTTIDNPSEEVPEAPSTPVQEITTAPAIDYTKYYIGYINIPKIELKRGFTDISSKYNNVNKNIYVLPSSKFPNTQNGNLILASHSGSGSISFFRNLYKLEINDDVYITYDNHEYHYQIKNIYTELKDGDVAIKRNKKKTTLTLITCTKGDKTTQTIYICELV